MTGNRNIPRPALLPLTPLYALAVGIRNLLFDAGILRSVSFKLPVISGILPQAVPVKPRILNT
jgi:hypothetical protein